MSTCQIFAAPDHDETGSRLCSDEDGGELTVFHASTIRTEGGVLQCAVCGLRDDEVSPIDSFVRPLPDGNWEAVGPAGSAP